MLAWESASRIDNRQQGFSLSGGTAALPTEDKFPIVHCAVANYQAVNVAAPYDGELRSEFAGASKRSAQPGSLNQG